MSCSFPPARRRLISLHLHRWYLCACRNWRFMSEFSKDTNDESTVEKKMPEMVSGVKKTWLGINSMFRMMWFISFSSSTLNPHFSSALVRFSFQCLGVCVGVCVCMVCVCVGGGAVNTDNTTLYKVSVNWTVFPSHEDVSASLVLLHKSRWWGAEVKVKTEKNRTNLQIFKKKNRVSRLSFSVAKPLEVPLYSQPIGIVTCGFCFI